MAKTKIFCIGRNKTGTTSLQRFFIDHGYKVGDQPRAELLIKHYVKRDWKPIIKYCRSYEVFQDIPFSLPYTYIVLDYHFPGSKFILTVRDSPEEWYNSLINFHSRLFAKNGNIPTKEDLQNAAYRYKGFVWDVNRAIYKTPENDPYNSVILKKHYEEYNRNVIDYFDGRPNLLIVNLKNRQAIYQISNFVNIKLKYQEFPWENRSSP